MYKEILFNEEAQSRFRPASIHKCRKSYIRSKDVMLYLDQKFGSQQLQMMV